LLKKEADKLHRAEKRKKQAAALSFSLDDDEQGDAMDTAGSAETERKQKADNDGNDQPVRLRQYE